MAKATASPKGTEYKLSEFFGLEIYGVLEQQQKGGPARIWIRIRRGNSGKIRLAASLNAAKSISLRFEEEANKKGVHRPVRG
jgi:hypothetical protein